MIIEKVVVVLHYVGVEYTTNLVVFENEIVTTTLDPVTSNNRKLFRSLQSNE